jgi:hypothetical protein
LPQHFADMHGWEEMVGTVVGVCWRLSPAEQKQCLLYVRNYGEAGAIDFFGPRYGLPRAVCAHNSYWFWGFGDWTGEVAITFGINRNVEECRKDLQSRFEQVELAATTNCELTMPYENGRPIFMCHKAKFSTKDLWPKERFFI